LHALSSAVTGAAARALRLLRHPSREWGVIAATPVTAGTLAGYLLLLACVPALCWMAGLAAFGLFGARGEQAVALSPLRVLHIGAVTFSGVILGVLLVAVSIWVVAPMYRVARDWSRSLLVATYAATPLLLAGVLLLVPVLVPATILAVGPALYGMSTGLVLVLAVKKGDAAEYVAIVCLALSVALTLIGGFAGALDLI